MSYKSCNDCGHKIGKHGCIYCNEESYIVDQYIEEGMALPGEHTEFMRKYREQQKQKQAS